MQFFAAGWFVWFYYHTVRSEWGEIARHGFRPDPFLFCVGTLLLFLGHSWQPVAFWFNFKLSGVSILLRDSFKLYNMAHIAHYLPGRIWSYFSFAYLGSFLGIGSGALLSALYLGMAASLLSGALFSVFALPLLSQLAHPYAVMAAFFVLLALLFLPKVFHFIIRTFGKLVRSRMAELPQPFGFRAILQAAGFYGISWFLNSAGVVFLTASFHPLDFQQVLYCFSIFSLAYLAGYLAFFTAGGLGVREGVMLAVLSQFLPLYAAAAVPVVARIMSLSFEGLWFLAVVKLPWKAAQAGKGK